MGIPNLGKFVRKSVPDGYFKVNIEHEIRKYYETAGSNPPPPVIVIDLMAFHDPFAEVDMLGQLCGGRFNVGFNLADRFFDRFKQLGVTLEFFYDGPLQRTKYQTWRKRQDARYRELTETINAVDHGAAIVEILSTCKVPISFYALKYVAKQHGRLTVSIGKECDQELAAYASEVGALAVLTDDSDFLIYDGSWRYWSTHELDFETFETMEYNRVGLIQHLQLDFKHMPLFATLCGNDIVPLQEVQYFHQKLGENYQKFYNVADFVRQQPIELLNTEELQSELRREIGRISEDTDFKLRFQQSLDFFDVNYTAINLNPTNDPIQEVLLELANSFAYHTWHGEPVSVSLGLADLRKNDLGKQIPHLLLNILCRMAGITLYHHPERRNRCSFYIKLDHDAGYEQHDFPVESPPRHLQPPTLIDLLSKDATIKSTLHETKLKLLCWIVSATENPLEYQRLEPVPRKLWATLLSLYFLVQQQVVKLFEADLLLQVAHDVVFATYDPLKVQNPTKIESRPLRLVNFYKHVHRLVTDAIDILGLKEKGTRSDPPFDGVLFHAQYAGWSWRGGNLAQIAPWRIYAKTTGRLLK